MKTQTTKVRTLIGILTIAGLWLPMADGCHKHAKALAAEPAAKARPYPLDKCVVSGEKLGAHGKPYVFNHEGQEIKMCCKDCLKDFKADPAKYLKQIEDANKRKK